MSSATEELRRLLDERGVEYYESPNGVAWGKLTTPIHGRMYTHYAVELDGLLCVDSHCMTPAQAVEATLGPQITGDTSDGYHTFNELYHHRAVLFSVIVRDHPEIAWKSKKHHDGTMYDGMFIVGVDTPQGQATYHYDIDPYWDIFDCRELDRAPEWDGHTSDEAIERIATLGRGTCVLHGCEGSFAAVNRPVWRCDCGAFVTQYTDATTYHKPRYCPNCGREAIA